MKQQEQERIDIFGKPVLHTVEESFLWKLCHWQGITGCIGYLPGEMIQCSSVAMIVHYCCGIAGDCASM